MTTKEDVIDLINRSGLKIEWMITDDNQEIECVVDEYDGYPPLENIMQVISSVQKEAAAYRWAYEYLQSRMNSIDRHGWAHDCDEEIQYRISKSDI